jgi:hypothetical protein
MLCDLEFSRLMENREGLRSIFGNGNRVRARVRGRVRFRNDWEVGGAASRSIGVDRLIAFWKTALRAPRRISLLANPQVLFVSKIELELELVLVLGSLLPYCQNAV